jgi:alpha-ribazole phosphatase
MEIYLIRHTTPLIDKNICYGQADIDVHISFQEEAQNIKKLLPQDIDKVYCSPLTRCRKLAKYLFQDQKIEYSNELKEINCGEWELKKWDEIDQIELNAWMKDFVNIPFPGGENLTKFHKRVIDLYAKISKGSELQVVLITHAGVIRSILSFITSTPMELAFDRFKIEYGSVIYLNTKRSKIEYKC